jgi:hypothetical protein
MSRGSTSGFDPEALSVDWATLLGRFDLVALSTELANLMEASQRHSARELTTPVAALH